jgi:hypothetical protein
MASKRARSAEAVLFAPPHRDVLSAQHPFAGWLTRRRLPGQDSTVIAFVEMSQSSWLTAGTGFYLSVFQEHGRIDG